MNFKTLLLSIALIMTSATGFSANEEHHHQHGNAMSTPLTEAGNDAFATIQEVVQKLLANPKTDWSRVNLEALRQHLIDMRNFTLNVKVIKQKPINGGVMFTVKATTPGTKGSLARLFSAHPAILKQESGWTMTAKKNKDGSYTAQVVGKNKDDVAKIRGLGYIGLIAYGKHHQLHHWMMATGVNPHQHHH